MKKIERLNLWQETKKGRIATHGAYKRKDYCIVKTTDLDALVAELEKHQWISVNDKLPKKSAIDKPVKVWITYYGYMSEAYFSDKGEFCKEWDGKRYYSKITGVTHWMSLPAPPQEDEG